MKLLEFLVITMARVSLIKKNNNNILCHHLSLPAARLNSLFGGFGGGTISNLLSFAELSILLQFVSFVVVKKIAPMKDSTTHSRPTSSCDTTAAATTSHRASSRALVKSISPGSRSTINSVK